MTRKELTIAQEVALSDVTRLRRNLKDAKRIAMEEARRRIEREMDERQRELDLAVRRAFELDTPKIRIYQDGLGTKDPYTLERSLARTDGLPSHMAGPGHPFFAWDDRPTGRVLIRYVDFPTTSPADDYPEILEGVVMIENGVISVVEDRTERETEYGVIPGFIQWELDRPLPHDDENARHLGVLIREWVERN